MAKSESTGARQRTTATDAADSALAAATPAIAASVQAFETNVDGWCVPSTRVEPALIFNPRVSHVDLLASLEGRAVMLDDWLGVLECGQGFDAEDDHATVYSHLRVLAQEIKLFVEEVGRRHRARGFAVVDATGEGARHA